MDLDLDDYQVIAVQTFREFLTRTVTPQRVRDAATRGGHDSEIWCQFNELGGVTLSVPEELGGGGGSLLDAALIAVECGRRLAPLPYADAVSGIRLLTRSSGPASLPDVGPDDLVVAGRPLSFEWDPQGRLTAHLPWVRGGRDARFMTVIAGGRVALLDLEAVGVNRTNLPNLGQLSLADVRVARIVPLMVDDIESLVVDNHIAELCLLRAAELVGAGRQALTLACEHVVTRRQFGRAIGSFQAIQHRLADCLTALDAAELLLWRAASYEGDVAMLVYQSAVALIQACQAAERSATESLQFFGGYGFTLEYDIHLYLRFIKSLAVLSQSLRPNDAAFQSPSRARADAEASWTSE